MATKCFDIITLLRFAKTKISKDEFYGGKKSIKTLDFHVKTIFISKLIEIENNHKYMTGYLDEVIRPLVLISPKMLKF